MSSTSLAIANKVIANNGIYVAADGSEDPQAYCVFKIRNTYFGHVHPVIAYSAADMKAYTDDHELVEVMWHRDSKTTEDYI